MAHVIDGNRFTSSSTPQHDLGASWETPDGRVFRYVQAGGTALVAGKLQQGSAIVANHQNIAVAAAVAIDATVVTATLGATAATANQYSNGYMIVNDVTGEGFYYTIGSHAAVSSSGVITLNLNEAIRVALTTSSEVSLIANPFSGVIINPTTPTQQPIGVAVDNTPANYYGWVQTHGVCNVLADGAISVGAAISPSNAVAGAVESGVIGQGVIGHALQAGVDTEYRTVFLMID